jgi:branched-chain amino acid transport system ATP-binding protein
VLSIVVLSGGKSVRRIIIAAAIFYLIPELLRGFKEYRLLIFGAFLIVFPVYEDRLKNFDFFSRKQPSQPGIKAEVAVSNVMVSVPAERTTDRNLVVKGLTKEYSGLKALDNVTLERQLSRNITGLIGPNGAGKTTFFNCLSGLEKPTLGTISFCDIENIAEKQPYELAKSGIGRTFQNVRLFKTMSVFQNVLIGSYCGWHIPFVSSLLRNKKYREFTRHRAEHALTCINLMGLATYKDQNISTLPFGVQRKVEIARALATKPKLLLLDEVASGLNDAEKRELSDRLKKITLEMGLSILLVEHDMSFVLGLAEHIIVLDAGKVIAQGLPGEVAKNEKVIESYLGTAYACG